jgi:HPt (histidine-containing phosphotransfer) domain-containing protein
LEGLLVEAFPQDPDKLARVAHKLRGQVAYFGVPQLHFQLEELDRAVRRRDCQPCEPLLLNIRQQLAQLYARLQERVQQIK